MRFLSAYLFCFSGFEFSVRCHLSRLLISRTTCDFYKRKLDVVNLSETRREFWWNDCIVSIVSSFSMSFVEWKSTKIDAKIFHLYHEQIHNLFIFLFQPMKAKFTYNRRRICSFKLHLDSNLSCCQTTLMEGKS